MKTVITCYSPYGQKEFSGEILGFNGYVRSIKNTYALGNGHRLLSSVLMRFSSPDTLSPFKEGGLNSYAYCSGDPINRSDPTGHFFQWILKRNKPTYLSNHYPKILKREIALVRKIENSTGQDPRRLVTQASDVTKAGVGVEQKYVLTKGNQLIVAASGDKKSSNYISHPTLAELAASKKVISAGTFRTGSLGEVFIYNRSGHYRPTFDDLSTAVEKFRTLGFEPSAVELTF